VVTRLGVLEEGYNWQGCPIHISGCLLRHLSYSSSSCGIAVLFHLHQSGGFWEGNRYEVTILAASSSFRAAKSKLWFRMPVYSAKESALF
jgi:hypothetical protein